MPSQYDVDTIVKGIEISWTTWGKMRDKQLVLGDISYVKSENGRALSGFSLSTLKKIKSFAFNR